MISIKQGIEVRRADKVDEYLYLAGERVNNGDFLSGISLLLSAIKQYGASYQAVVVTIENAKRRRAFPPELIIPGDLTQFNEMYSKYIRIQGYGLRK